MLELNAINQFYGESHTLRDVTLSVPKGSCICLMGRNGVGKTTLLKALMGLLPVASGTVKFEDKEFQGLPPEARARNGIAYVPQGRDIFPLLTVEENLRIGMGAAGARRIPDQVFELFPVLRTMLRRRGGDLSGGQQQQLAIGRALVLNPKLMILDEPTEGIQPNIVQEIGNIIMRLNREQGLTVLLVEQKIAFARRVGQRFCILDKGHNVATGEMSELSESLINQHLRV